MVLHKIPSLTPVLERVREGILAKFTLELFPGLCDCVVLLFLLNFGSHPLFETVEMNVTH